MKTARLTKRFALAMSVLGVAMVSGMAAPAVSQADACGYEYFNGFQSNWGWIPSGQLYHCIDTASNDGQYILTDGANFGSASNICDPSMRFTYGNGAYYLDGNVHWGCSRGGQWKYTLNWRAPRGSACAELWAKNWRVRVARQCHYVYS